MVTRSNINDPSGVHVTSKQQQFLNRLVEEPQQNGQWGIDEPARPHRSQGRPPPLVTAAAAPGMPPHKPIAPERGDGSPIDNRGSARTPTRRQTARRITSRPASNVYRRASRRFGVTIVSSRLRPFRPPRWSALQPRDGAGVHSQGRPPLVTGSAAAPGMTPYKPIAPERGDGSPVNNPGPAPIPTPRQTARGITPRPASNVYPRGWRDLV